MAKAQRVLFTRTDTSPEKTLLMRVGIVLILMFLVVTVLWVDREGLKDHADGHVSFSDVVYFAIVTITSVGYGDIVPVTERARLIDAFYVTPIRIFIWFIFLGTAYQFVFQKFMEDYRMAKLERRLDKHMIICGYGHTGRFAAQELMDQGRPPEEIVIIDMSNSATQEAAEAGFIAFRGDASKEEILKRASLGKATAVIITTGRDDTAVLIALTVRNMNQGIKLICGIKEEENRKLIKQAGADVIISPSTVGGYLLADAVNNPRAVEYLYDLMTASGRVNLLERLVQPEEMGRAGREVHDGAILRIHRGPTTYGFWDIENTVRMSGDLLIIIAQAKNANAQP